MALALTGQPQNSALVVGGSDVSSGNPVPVSGSIAVTGTVPVTDTAAEASLAALAALIVASAFNVNLLTKIAGEDITDDVMKVEGQFTYAHISTATTTVVKSGAGLLHRIGLNTPVAAGTITIYDNTAGSGTVVAVITTPSSPGPVSFDYDVKFNTGLTLVTVGAQDITVSYR